MNNTNRPFQFGVRFETNVGFEFHLIRFLFGRGDRFFTIQLNLEIADAIQVDALSFPKTISHEMT